jgi:hypothetical protein
MVIFELNKFLKKGFKVPREVPENFISFLMMSHNRLGIKSPGYRLPTGLYRHIYNFLKRNNGNKYLF